MPRQRTSVPEATPATKSLLLAVMRLELEPDHPAGKAVAAGALAERLKLAPSSVTEMLQRAARDGFLNYRSRRGASLSDPGRVLAMHLLRRHRLIETFLQRTLGFDWSEVHAEAERLEGSASDAFIERVDQVLDHPLTDPHGDPIPNIDGVLAKPEGRPVTTHPVGSRLRLVRVLGNDGDFLRLLGGHGLAPSSRFTLASINETAGTVELSLGRGKKLILGHSATQRMIATTS